MGTAAQRVVIPQPPRPVEPTPKMDPHSVFTHPRKKTPLPLPVPRRRPAFDPSEPIDATLLRKMIVYREILDPPIALRNEQVWER